MATSFFYLIFQSMFECASPTREKMEVYDMATNLGVLSSDDSSDSFILDTKTKSPHHYSPSDSFALQDPYAMFALRQQREILRHQMRATTNNKDVDISMVREHFRGLFRCDAMDLTYRNKEDNSILLPELETGLLHRCDAMDLTYPNRRGEDNSALLVGVGMDEYFQREQTRMEKNHSDQQDETKRSNNGTSSKDMKTDSCQYEIQLERKNLDGGEPKKGGTTSTVTQIDDSYRYVIRLAPQHAKLHFPHKLHSYRGDHPELTLRCTQSESLSQLPELLFQC